MSLHMHKPVLQHVDPDDLYGPPQPHGWVGDGKYDVKDLPAPFEVDIWSQDTA